MQCGFLCVPAQAGVSRGRDVKQQDWEKQGHLTPEVITIAMKIILPRGMRWTGSGLP